MNDLGGRLVRRHRRWHAAAHRLKHSLRWRLTLLFVVLALAMTAVFLFGSQRVLRSGWQGWARPLVSDYLDRLAGEIGSPPDIARARAIADRLPVTVHIDGPTVRFDSHPLASGPLRYGRDHDTVTDGYILARTTADGHRIVFGLAALSDPDRPRRVGLLTLAGLLALTALAYAVVRRLLAPLGPIGEGVERFGRGEFDAPIEVQRRDELGELALRINGMAGSLQGMLDAKRGLLLAISHELRSPLTRARLNAELVAEGPERAALLRDLGEMSQLIGDLLEGERMAAGHRALQIEPVDLPALVRAAAADAAAAPAAVAPTLAIDDDAGRVDADPTRLRLLLRNLLDNAGRHAGDAATPPVLFLRREDDGRWALGVRDHGPGVAEEQRARLAEAFYRPDSARTRAAGGVGLGLYLCRLVAVAHGGELRLRHAGPGLEVAMVWQPAAR